MRGVVTILIDEVHRNVNRELMKSALEAEKVSTYVDSVIRVMRDTIRMSNVCKFNDKIHVFNGEFYEPIQYPQFRFALEEAMKEYDVNASYWGRIVDSCASEIEGKEVSSAPNHVICFTNGVVNLEDESLTLMPFSSDFYVFYQLPYPFEPNARHRRWTRFLNQVLPEKELQHVLQEFLGLIFVDRGMSKLEKILWLVGEGANGKGVVFETIMGVLGRENCTNIDLAELTSGSNRDKNIARINGKLLNYCSEVSRKSIASDFAKALISGEPLPARELYGMPFTAYNIPLMMANTNKMPKTSDNTYAYFRRMIIMPFNVTIPEDMQDKNLAYKLKDEYSGILNWILAGRKRIVSNNFRFTKSSLVEQRLTDYIYEDGSITHFLRDSGYARKKDDITDRGITITATELYGEYVRWCEKKGVDDDVRISSVKKLAILMGELKYKKERGGDGVRIRLYGRYHNRF